ncbi:DUF484 family protein [Elioraea tepida]|jgi:hypothetical protein|uniref:DUF484 family protein n=1 Tax=Elioraea tepida TaxID=2843330 RepID=A0A975TZF5_9PROT|nr:DUF484 family protein [Elioraea tepida]QXM23327.1 DUF484 family protein [Elioraea tepida]
MSGDKPRRVRGQAQEPDEAAQVEAYLRAHPGFLAERPSLYRTLLPPRRVHGERLADHMAAMLEAERARGAELRATLEELVAHGRHNAANQARAHKAVLALMAARSAAEALDIIVQDWPDLLGLDVVSVCAEGRAVLGARPLARGTIARLLPNGSPFALRSRATDQEALYGEAAALVASDALARLTLASGGEALLACGSRDPGHFEARQATDLVSFLAAAAAVALGRG